MGRGSCKSPGTVGYPQCSNAADHTDTTFFPHQFYFPLDTLSFAEGTYFSLDLVLHFSLLTKVFSFFYVLLWKQQVIIFQKQHFLN